MDSYVDSYVDSYGFLRGFFQDHRSKKVFFIRPGIPYQKKKRGKKKDRRIQHGLSVQESFLILSEKPIPGKKKIARERQKDRTKP